MSKDSALAVATGTPAPLSPGLSPVEPAAPALPSVDSDRFAKLAAKEEALVKQREAFKSEQQKMYEEKAQLKAIQDKINRFEEMRKTAPIDAIKELGFSETDLFNYMAEKKDPTPDEIAVKKAQEIIDARFKEEDEKRAAKEKEELAKRDDAAIASFKQGIGKTIEKEAEKYEYCAFKGEEASNLVYQTILEIIKTEPEIAPHKAMQEALELVEKNYEDEDLEMSKLKKRQPKVEATPTPAEKPARVRSPQAPPAKPAPTITNKTTATVASTATVKETPSQKRARLENWLRTGVKS